MKILLILICIFIGTNFSLAKQHPNHAILVVDRDTGSILHEENASEYRYPASITKVMTLYLAFEALKLGKLDINEKIYISKHAASMAPLKINLRAGEYISVRDAILGAAIRSANDCAVVLAEAISGSEQKFAELMNKRATMLGMNNTIYHNASGLPGKNHNRTTAYDIAKAAIAIQRDFPEYYSIFSRKEFIYKGVKYRSTNGVLSKHNYEWATGLKTGFINASGFNLVTTAKRGERNIVGVVLGSPNPATREKKMISLLNKFLGLPENYSMKPIQVSKKTNKNISKKSNKKIKLAMR